MKENLLISKCLLGINCKYNSQNNLISQIDSLKSTYNLIPVCPEMDGGLPCPRTPCEIKGKKVISKEGVDCTKEYVEGANHALKLCKELNIKKALLKEKSPSCGSTLIYDGSFTSKLIEGKGVTSSLLIENNIEVFSENDIEKLLR